MRNSSADTNEAIASQVRNGECLCYNKGLKFIYLSESIVCDVHCYARLNIIIILYMTLIRG